MDNNFISNTKSLLNSLPTLTGDAARLAHRLSRAIDRLETVTEQANAQFKVGDRYATFNRQTIQAVESE